jgi:hypothetical protein
MSDEQKDQVERAEDDRADEAVEAHSFEGPVGSPVDSPISATEEPPDVEGHMHGGRPIDPRPID